MCTVICRWSPGDRVPVQLLALRDERASRRFDPPGAWWTAQPEAVGGRDQLGGGTWCATDVRTGTTAVVLNRAERPVAAAGAPSRGVLPLLAVEAGGRWPDRIELAPMASFNLVLSTPEALSWWSYDGRTLAGHRLAPGTHMFTPKGLAPSSHSEPFAAVTAEVTGRSSQGPAPDGTVWPGWLELVQATRPSSDPLALLVRIPLGEDSFETVFGQFIAAIPGSIEVRYSTTPDRQLPWTTVRWQLADASGDRPPVLVRGA